MLIGPHELPNRLFVAPMAGVTDRPFRQLCKRLGAGYAVSEMVTSRKELWNSLKTSRRANHAGETAPIAVQIAGTDAAMMAEATAYNIERGAQKSASGRGLVEAEAGDAITVNPGEVHDGAPLGEGPRAWRMLYLRSDLVGTAAADIFEGRPREEFYAPVLADARIARLVSASLAALLSSDAAPLAGEDRLLLLLATVLRERAPPR